MRGPSPFGLGAGSGEDNEQTHFGEAGVWGLSRRLTGERRETGLNYVKYHLWAELLP